MAVSSIELRLGQYVGRKNVANKNIINTSYAGNVTPFGEFTPRNAQFVLDDLYNVNYGYFVFNGITFWGYVDVSVHTKGYYIYTFRIDGLTTAYKNGCFNTNVFVEYASIGASNISNEIKSIPDSRCKIQPLPVRNFVQITDASNAFYIILNVNTQITANSTTGTSGNPTTISYVMTNTQYNEFLTKVGETFRWLDENVSNQVLNSIVNCYIIPKKYVDESWLGDTTDVRLGGFINVQLDIGTTMAYHEWSVPVSGLRFIGHRSAAYEINFNVTSDYINHFNYITSDKAAEYASLEITMHGEFIGSLNFSPCTYGFNTMFGLGMKVVIEYGSGMICFYPTIRESSSNTYTIIDRTLRCETKLTEIMPTLQSTGDNLGLYKTMVSFACGFASNAAAGNIGGTVKSVVETAGELFFNQAPSQANIEPVTGGSIDRASHQGSYLYLKYNQYIPDYNNFTRLYGRPVFKMMNLSSSEFNNVDYTGYCQTRECQLQQSAGVPDYVIEEANSMLNAGAYIGLANQP